MKINAALLLALFVVPVIAQDRLPIIDVHLHATSADSEGPPPLAMCTPMEMPAWDPSTPYGAAFVAIFKQPACDDPVWSPMSDDALMRETIEVMQRRNIIGVLSGSPDRVADWVAAAPGRFLPGHGFQLGRDHIPADSVRTLHATGRVAVFAEVTNQYVGIAPDNERMEPYWTAAEDAGFGNRVMFGSDQMVWPGVIERAIAVIEEAPFLGERQKRDILHNNAARFLRLSDEEIERHHRR